MQFTYTFGLLSLLLCGFVQATPIGVDGEVVEIIDSVVDDLQLGGELLLSRQSTTSVSMTNNKEFIKAMLAGHNWYRAQHSANPLTWDPNRAATSAEHSAKCKFKHSGARGSGENIALGYNNVAAAVNGWGGERVKYDWNTPKFSAATGHFTQVVWKNTKVIGCGRTLCPKGWFTVCQYGPPGNYVGGAQFTRNVGRQIKGKITDRWNGQYTSPRDLGRRSNGRLGGS